MISEQCYFKEELDAKSKSGLAPGRPSQILPGTRGVTGGMQLWLCVFHILQDALGSCDARVPRN